MNIEQDVFVTRFEGHHVMDVDLGYDEYVHRSGWVYIAECERFVTLKDDRSRYFLRYDATKQAIGLTANHWKPVLYQDLRENKL